MKRKTALRLYRFLFVTQLVALALGSVKIFSAVMSREYRYLIPCLVGLTMGIGLAMLWSRQLKQVEATSEEQWNRAWHIHPSDKV
jgi:hypothetical protein